MEEAGAEEEGRKAGYRDFPRAKVGPQRSRTLAVRGHPRLLVAAEVDGFAPPPPTPETRTSFPGPE